MSDPPSDKDKNHNQDKDQQLVQLKLKKYMSKYEYMSNEYNETLYLFRKYKSQFESECPKKNKKKPPAPPKDEDDSTTDATSQEDDKADKDKDKDNGEEQNEDEYEVGQDDPDIVKHELDETMSTLLKKLYRLLSLKTHPDKYHDSDKETREEKEIEFHEVQQAYKLNDILKLLFYANKYQIKFNKAELEYIYLNSLDFDSQLEKCINALAQKIAELKDTLAWNWALADEAKKNEFRSRYNL